MSRDWRCVEMDFGISEEEAMRKPRRVLRWGLNQLGLHLHRHRQDLGILELGFVLVWEGIGRKRDFGV
ncbi:hypothetical protein PS2_031909 [Malus domestica]